MRIITVIAFVASIFIIACNNEEKKADVNVTGAYKMLSQRLKSDSTDTTNTSLQQLKIFTGDHMMYANINSPDSVSSFGVGSYTIAGDTVTENVIFSAGDSTRDDTARSFKLAITKTDKGYKQVIPDIGSGNQHFVLTEEYENAGTETKTPLDGVWKHVSGWSINGKDSVPQKLTQYKAFFAGHVIWGHSVTDSLGKIHTGIGFGKFELNGNRAKESLTASTYYQVRGQSFDLDIELKGTDEFVQTIVFKDGSKEIETYQRLKKQ
jgi:hypothetical protein